MRAADTRAGARGFTLLEVLVAITIVAFIMVAVFGSMAKTLQSKEVAEERAELYALGRETVLRMADEIQAALHPRGGERFLLFGGRGELAPSEDEIAFVKMNRGGWSQSAIKAGPVMVRYFLEPLPRSRGLYTLWRHEAAWSWVLGRADQAELEESASEEELEEEDQRLNEQFVDLLTCDDLGAVQNVPGSCVRVAGLKFRYYDEEAGVQEAWDSNQEDGPQTQRLPAAVGIDLTLLDERGRPHLFTTIVDVALALGQPTPRPGGGTDEDDEEPPRVDQGGEGPRRR